MERSRPASRVLVARRGLFGLNMELIELRFLNACDSFG